MPSSAWNEGDQHPTGSIRIATKAERTCIRKDHADQRDDQAFFDQCALERFNRAVNQVGRSYTASMVTPCGRPAETSAIFSFRLWITSSAFWP